MERINDLTPLLNDRRARQEASALSTSPRFANRKRCTCFLCVILGRVFVWHMEYKDWEVKGQGDRHGRGSIWKTRKQLKHSHFFAASREDRCWGVVLSPGFYP